MASARHIDGNRAEATSKKSETWLEFRLQVVQEKLLTSRYTRHSDERSAVTHHVHPCDHQDFQHPNHPRHPAPLPAQVSSRRPNPCPCPRGGDPELSSWWLRMQRPR